MFKPSVVTLLALIVVLSGCTGGANQPTGAGVNSSQRCSGVPLYLKELPEEVRANEKVITKLEEKCLWVLDTQNIDLNNDGLEELILTTSGAGCVSCHAQHVFVYSKNLLIFESDMYDGIVSPEPDLPGFSIKSGIEASKGICESAYYGNTSKETFKWTGSQFELVNKETIEECSKS